MKKSLKNILSHLAIAGILASVAVLLSVQFSLAQNEESEEFYEEGLDALDDEDYETAIEEFSAAIDLAPDYADAYLGRALAYIATNKALNAIDDAGTAYELDLDNDEVYPILAQAFALNGNYRQAIANYSEAIERDDDNLDWYMERGKLHALVGNFVLAQRDFDHVLESESRNEEARRYRAWVFYLSGQYLNAIDDLTILIEDNPDAELYNQRGLAYEGLRAVPLLAIEDFTEAIDLNPDNPQYYVNRGRVMAQIGEFDLAIEDFEEAIDIDSEFAPAYYNRGVIYLVLEDVSDAFDDFTTAIELDPTGMLIAYYRRGNISFDSGDFEEALDDFSRAIEISPQFAAAYNKRGEVYASMENYELAIADFSRSIEITSDFVAAYNNRGDAYSAIGESDLATADYDFAFELEPVLRVNSWARVFTFGDSLRLRARPNLSSPVLENLISGTTVIVVDGPETADGLVWWRVQTPIGVEGWTVEATETEVTLIPMSNTERDSLIGTCSIVAAGRVNVRSGPGTNNGIQRTLESGEINVVINRSNRGQFIWWQLFDGNWVRSDVVGLIGECLDLDEQVAASASEESQTCTVSSNSTVNLRTGPGTNFDRGGTLAGGDSATVIDRTTASDGFIWYQLESELWVRSDVVNDESCSIPVAIATPDPDFEPPENRDTPPSGAVVLTGGIGLTDGRPQNPGAFQIEWYCGERSSGVDHNENDWFCLNPDRSVDFTLTPADFDTICQESYSHPNAFAIQDGSSNTPAFNWRCYAYP